MAYKKGQQLLAADANRFVEHLDAEPISPAAVFEPGAQTLARTIDNRGRILLEPIQTLNPYETMKGAELIGIDPDSQQPIFAASNADMQNIIDGANTFYVTCGPTGIAASTQGWGEILREGQWYWVKAESGVFGYCGLEPGSSIIKQHYFGFISVGTTTANGITLAYVSPYSGQMFRMKSKPAGIPAGTYAKAFIMRPTVSGWVVTTLELDVWAPTSLAVGASKELIVGYTNGRLTVIVEACV